MKKRIYVSISSLIVASMLFSSCATIFGKSSYPVSINTNPAGANISITDKKGTEVYKGQSPTTVTLKSSSGYFSKAQYQVKLNSPGYAEQIVPINYKLNGWYFGNILIGGLIGMLIVDPATGAMYKLDTPAINVTLNKNSVVDMPSLKILNISDLTPEMKKQLVQLN
jgi:hypothetical protein